MIALKIFGYQSIRYDNISVPNGWLVECKVYHKLDSLSYSAIGYDSNITIASEKAAMLVHDQISKNIFSYKIISNVEPSIDNPLPPLKEPIKRDDEAYQKRKNN